MPLSFEEKSTFFSSGENEAPITFVVAMNWSMAYCFDGRAEGFFAGAAGGAPRARVGTRATTASARKTRDDMQPPGVEGSGPLHTSFDTSGNSGRGHTEKPS